jgi:glycosyltransferase involved in cell wall biosynthesis
MKVLQITPVAPPHRSGMAVAAGEIARATAAAGADITLVSSLGHEPIAGVNVQTLPSFRIPGAGFLSFTPALFGIIKNGFLSIRGREKIRTEFDLLHLHYPCFGNAAVVHKALWLGAKTPLIVSYHMDAVGRGIRKPVFWFHQKFLAPRLLRRAKKIVVASRDYAEHSLLAKHPELMTKVVEIPFGVDTLRFSPAGHRAEAFEEHRVESSPRDSSEARPAWEAGRRGFRERDDLRPALLFVGGLDEQHYFKGLDVLLQALTKVPGATLTIVGSGELQRDYARRANALKIGERVFFAGKVSDKDLPDFYRAADLLVLPSIDRSEAYGIVLMEAAASGIPSVASALPGVRTVVKDNETGLLVPPGDVDALASAINRLLVDTSCRQKMGATARIFAESRTWKMCGEMYVGLYRTINNVIPNVR